MNTQPSAMIHFINVSFFSFTHIISLFGQLNWNACQQGHYHFNIQTHLLAVYFFANLCIT